MCRAAMILGLGVVVIAIMIGGAQADIDRYLLPNGEPIVGVYYYPWYAGPPYRHVGWTPEFAYDNIGNSEHIYHVLRAMTDYGINHAAYSYWNNAGNLDGLVRTFEENEKLLGMGRPLFISPYLEPPTINKRFADEAAQDANTEFITRYLTRTGEYSSFAELGGDKFTNIYVTYYVPTETDEDFRAFLRAKYGDIEALRRAWSMRGEGERYSDQGADEADLPESLGAVTIQAAKSGTRAFADVQELRARRLRDGWAKTMADAQEKTGYSARYTGDVSNTIVSPVEYMPALTGLTWYSFGYAINSPFQRPKMISEIAKYTDTTFLYTIAPGYVDRQQRWPGARYERDPFLYPYAWVHAMKTLPEGIMILTHSEWFEGSIIDVTREYGKRPYETTELYSSVFRATFPSIYETKRAKKPVAVILNEWATWNLRERGKGVEDVYGLIKALECLSVQFDVIPDSKLTEEELDGRRLVFVPNCGASLRPGANEIVMRWARHANGASVVTDRSVWWAAALGLDHEEGKLNASTPRTRSRAFGSEAREIGEGSALYVDAELGSEFLAAFRSEAAKGKLPEHWLAAFEDMVDADLREGSSSHEITRGPVLSAANTIVIPACNVIPWGLLVEEGGLRGGSHSDADTRPWRRQDVRFSVPVGDRPVSELVALDSDSGRFKPVEFTVRDGEMRFSFPMKFHALFAAPQSPVRLQMPVLSIHPGETTTVAATVGAFARGVFSGEIRLRKTPGLTMQPATFSVPQRQRRKVQLTFTADKSYATGNRVIALDVRTDEDTAVFWRPAVCRAPALIGTRTKLLSGVAGESAEVAVRLVNVGQARATDLSIELLGAQATLGGLAAADEQTVRLEPTFPELSEPGETPEAELSVIFDDPPQANGLRPISEGDGVVERIEREGTSAVIPDQSIVDENGRRPRFMYIDITDPKLTDGDYELEAEIEFFDEGQGAVLIEYDSTFGDETEDYYRDTKAISLRNTGEWRTATFPMRHARMSGRQNYGGDFRTSGVVAIRRITVRPLRRLLVERRSAEMAVSYQSHGQEWTQRLTVDVLLHAQRSEAERPGGVPDDAIRIASASPYAGHVPEYPVEVALPKWALDRVRNAAGIGAMSDEGVRISAELEQGMLRYTAPVGGPGGAVWVWPSSETTSGGVEIQAGDTEHEIYVTARNAHLSLLWDELKGGALVSLISRETGREYAAFPAGALTCEYTLPDGRHEVSSAYRGTLNPGREGLQAHAAAVDSEVQLPHCQVNDHWSVFADSRVLRLDRIVRFTRGLEAKEFSPLCLRLDPQHFRQVLPLGVGFQKEGAPSRGWAETWHLPGWHFCFAGAPGSAADSVSLCVVNTRPLSRVRSGFIPGEMLPEATSPGFTERLGDELQIRYTGRRKYDAGDEIRLTALLLVGPEMDYRVAQEARLLALRGPLVSVGDDVPYFDGLQTVEPRAPEYMFEVREPEFE